jgi:hypothetical protein
VRSKWRKKYEANEVGRFGSSGILLQPLQQGFIQHIPLDRLGDMVVHAGGDGARSV